MRQKQQLIHRMIQSELNSTENAMCVTQLLEDAHAGKKNKLFPFVCNDFIATMTQHAGRAAVVYSEYTETKLLSEKDATVLVQAFLIFTGNLLIPSKEVAVFFGGSGIDGADRDVRHAWITLIFTEAGQVAMVEGAKAMELELVSREGQHDVATLMVETLRKGELGVLLQHSLAALPAPCWITDEQRRTCLSL